MSDQVKIVTETKAVMKSKPLLCRHLSMRVTDYTTSGSGTSMSNAKIYLYANLGFFPQLGISL